MQYASLRRAPFCVLPGRAGGRSKSAPGELSAKMCSMEMSDGGGVGGRSTSCAGSAPTMVFTGGASPIGLATKAGAASAATQQDVAVRVMIDGW